MINSPQNTVEHKIIEELFVSQEDSKSVLPTPNISIPTLNRENPISPLKAGIVLPQIQAVFVEQNPSKHTSAK